MKGHPDNSVPIRSYNINNTTNNLQDSVTTMNERPSQHKSISIDPIAFRQKLNTVLQTGLTPEGSPMLAHKVAEPASSPMQIRKKPEESATNNWRKLEAAVLPQRDFESNRKLLEALDRDDYQEAAGIVSSSVDSHLANLASGPLRVTPLQIAASKGDVAMPVIKVMLGRGANPNLADKLGRTPLHYAAATGSTLLVAALLTAGACVNSRFRVDGGCDEDTDGGVFNARVKSEVETKNLLIGTTLPVPECLGRTPLHQAVKGGHPAVVHALIVAGADVNAEDDKGLNPLLLAGAGVGVDDTEEIARYERIVELLVSAGSKVNGRNPDTGTTALYHAAALRSTHASRRLLDAGAKVTTNMSGETVLHEAARQGVILVVKTIVESQDGRLYVNSQDQVGRTPLHLATYNGDRVVLAYLVQNGGDLSVRTSTGVAVIDAIFSHIPRPIQYISDILDSAIMPNSATVNDRTFKIHMDFSLLAPRGSHHQMEVVTALVTGASYYQKMVLLQHPVLETFLRLKWRKLRIFFLMLVAINVCFVAALSSYVVIMYRKGSCVEVVTRRVVLASAAILLVQSMGQVFVLPRQYIRHFETWLSISRAAMALIVTASNENLAQIWAAQYKASYGVPFKCTAFDDTTPAVYPPPNYLWTLHLMALSILLAWGELMLLIGRFPSWGLYALMFYAVFKNVLKVLLTFVCLLFGFAFSFYILFHHDEQAFKEPWRAFVKTTVMMMGEYEYNDMFNDMATEMSNVTANVTTYMMCNMTDNATCNNSAMRMRLPVTSRIVFLLFVVLTSIVLMNLMVGLAVSDIQALEKESNTRRRLLQADFVALLERFILRHRSCTLLPFRLHRWLEKRLSVDTALTLQPSEYAAWRSKVNYAVLDAIVSVAVKNQPRSHHHKSLGPSASVTQQPRSAVDDNDLRALLQSLRSELNELRDSLALDRNTDMMRVRPVAHDVMSYDLRMRESSAPSRPLGARFSAVVSLATGRNRHATINDEEFDLRMT